MSGVPSELAVVHLVWAPLGPEPFARFLESYRDHAAGADHRLVVVFKEFRDDAHRAPWDKLVASVDHERVDVPERTLDLADYRAVARGSTASALCFLNSYSSLLADGWLALWRDRLRDRGVGMVAAGGSWESAFSAAPVWMKPKRLLHFRPFPNPHLRTNAFMLERELMLALRWPEVGDKLSALRLESGRDSITRQVWDRELEAVVVGRDGRAFGWEEWPASHTFRSGDQRNLLVADNRTLQFDEADPARRRELARFAWGAGADRS